ncbi:MAG: hypothetical protein C0392_14035, partial [Syntrophus sp. (in: bacteria)]|nr:hypothetical protein [Syntrophus sp. (in: bacteria)]
MNTRYDQEEWRTFFQGITHPIIILDPQHRIVAANRAALNTLHKTEEEVRGNLCYELFHGIHQPAQGCPAEKLLLEGLTETIEMEMETLGGTYLISCTPVRDNSGNVYRVIHMAIDITNRKHTEEFLKESEEKYRALIETTNKGFVILDRDGAVMDANPEYVRLTGHQTLDEIQDKNVINWTAPHDIAKNTREIAGCFERGFVRNFEIDYIDKNGNITPVEINATVVETKNGTKIVTLCRDITERKHAEKQLQKEVDFNKTLIKTSPAFFVAIAADGKTILMNESMLDKLGYTIDEVAGKDYLSTFVPEEDRESLSAVFKALTEFKEPTFNRNRIVAKNGTNLLVEWRGRSVMNDKGEFEYFFGVGIDITARTMAEEALHASEEKYRNIFENAAEGI